MKTFLKGYEPATAAPQKANFRGGLAGLESIFIGC
jgi:hypothetical protein